MVVVNRFDSGTSSVVLARLRPEGEMKTTPLTFVLHGHVLLMCLFAVLGNLATAITAERSNVLLIAVDDLNDWEGVLGGHPQALINLSPILWELAGLDSHPGMEGHSLTPLLDGRLDRPQGLRRHRSGQRLDNE